MKSVDICTQCHKDKKSDKLFSTSNNMDPGKLPEERQDLTIIEQLISRLMFICLVTVVKPHQAIAYFYRRN